MSTVPVHEYRAGKIEFRADTGGNVHAPMGKRSFAKDALLENINTFIDYVKSIKPPAARGQYILRISLSTTMGPGIPVELI
jgi:large subunit ribosomal protein L1